MRVGMDECATANLNCCAELAHERKWKASNVPSTIDLRESRDVRIAKHTPGYAPQVIGIALWWARTTRGCRRALVATLLWLGLSKGFSLYVSSVIDFSV